MSPAQRKAVWDRIGMLEHQQAWITFSMIERASGEVQDRFLTGFLDILAANNITVKEVLY